MCIRSFGWEGSEVFQQQDVQELTRVLFDALEESFKGTEVENIIDELYAGELIDYLRCIDVDYQSERVDKFLDFALTIIPFGSSKALHSLSECIETYLRPEILDGENKYYAESVGRKVDAIKGLKFGKLPQIMSVQLKRFVYDFSGNSMVQKKLNDRVTFPMLLDMNTYVTRKSAQNKNNHDNNGKEHSSSEEHSLPDEGILDLEEGEFEKFLKEQIAILRTQQKSRSDDYDVDGDVNGSGGDGKKGSCDLYDSKSEMEGGNRNVTISGRGSASTSATTHSGNSNSKSGDDVLPSLYPSLSIPFIPIAVSTPISTAMATAMDTVSPVATATAIPVATAMAVTAPYPAYPMSSAGQSSSSFEVLRSSAYALGDGEDEKEKGVSVSHTAVNKKTGTYNESSNYNDNDNYNDVRVNDHYANRSMEQEVNENENENGGSAVVAVASAYLCPLFSKSDSDDDAEVDVGVGAGVQGSVATCAVAESASAFYYTAKSGVDMSSKSGEEIGLNSEKIGSKSMKKGVECQYMPSALEVKELLERRGEWMYELYAVLNHSGAISGGHYYAYIKDMESKKWYNFNDSNVTEISEEKVTESWGGKNASEGIDSLYFEYYLSSFNIEFIVLLSTCFFEFFWAQKLS
jgi:Ubiquitin carboxyl-terminal hydrolase